MTPTLRIGDPVQVHAETEVLTLVAIDGADAWCRDGAGGHVQCRLEDLERARSKAFRLTEETERELHELGPKYRTTGDIVWMPSWLDEQPW